MERIEMKEIESAIEGILFASGEPVHVDRICVALELDRPTADQVLQKLMDYYSYERRGIRLLHIEDSWQLCSAPDYADYIRKAFEIRKPAKLSQPALEVLTIIAYYQPTTRAFVDQIRGVDSAYTMGLLQERKLIEECGRLQVPGRPHLYRTTKQFLRAFHLTSLEERRRNENYLRVKSLASRLEPMGEFGRSIVTRNPEPMKRGKIYEYDQDKGDLILAMAEIRSRAERTLPPPRTAFENIVQHEPYPVESKAREILQQLKDHGITRFRLLFKGNRSRSEVVATFLAVLELCRAHVLHLAGSETDCTVRQEGELPENLML